MYLLRTKKCTSCNACLESCPISKNPKIQNCKHCPDAPCKEACKYNAFYEVSPGVYGIDPEICIGCGECAKACPYDAIVIEDNVAKKCTLCGECIVACPLNALKIVETEEEKREKEGLLGWKKLNKGEPLNVYTPSIQEARLLSSFLKLHREMLRERTYELEDLFEQFLDALGAKLDEDQFKGLLKLAEYETSSFSVITPLLENDELEEIAVIENDPIRAFHRKRGWIDYNIALVNRERIIELANKMASNLDRRLTLQEPRMNANLPDGSRLHAVIPPASHKASLTIRKFRKKPFSPRELIENNTLSSEALAFLWIGMQLDLNLVISGSTGSGKTTTLNTILCFLPDNQRLIIIEETPEIAVYHPHHVRLIVNKEKGLTMDKLVEDTLRMRPDKVIVGEVREKNEVKAWVNTMLAGQGKGSLATFHALSSRETINRLLSLGILETDLSALDLIIVQRRWTDYETGREIRRIFEITEVNWNKKINLNPIFVYDPGRDALVRTRNRSKVMERAKKFLKIDPRRELKRRSRFLEKTNPNLMDAFHQISRWGKRCT